MRKQLNTTIPEQLIEKMDKEIKESDGVYSNRSHFVELAIKAMLKKDKRKRL